MFIVKLFIFLFFFFLIHNNNGCRNYNNFHQLMHFNFIVTSQQPVPPCHPRLMGVSSCRVTHREALPTLAVIIK